MNKTMYNAPALKKAILILKILIEDYQPMGVVDVAKRIMIGKSATPPCTNDDAIAFFISSVFSLPVPTHVR